MRYRSSGIRPSQWLATPPRRPLDLGGQYHLEMDGSHSWILLTMGNRPTELMNAIASIRRQTVHAEEIIVVGNGCAIGPIESVRTISLPENLGATAGRNVGAKVAIGEVLFFLDDDAELIGDSITEQVLGCFRERPNLGAVALHVVDKDSGRTQRRHIPRLGARGALRSGDVTYFLEGACAIRRSAFEIAGGYPDEFFYGMEATDLAWRLIGQGYSIHYASGATVHHPATEPERHDYAYVLTARNRVWLARRQLPIVLQTVYLTIWTILMLVRAPSNRARRQIISGLADGARSPAPPPVQRMSWRTVWRLSRLGRPPVI